MAYNIFFDDKHSLIHLQFNSPDSIEEHLNATHDIYRLIQQHQCHKILVNLFGMNQHTHLNKLEQHEFTQQWNTSHFQNCIFAIVLPEQKAFQDDWYFIIHLIKLSGTLGQPFYALEQAMQWLMLD